ncbi:glycosyltransferase family 4 protein [Dyella sp. C9]|uniref:glycosyltransferase family 4 protein n=1 Tax=Dyella sp. C9 TaxID=2202154 RepID=UPI000DEF1054|nr:glycosyltransferase family 4 protein [Dyella sp. C9]
MKNVRETRAAPPPHRLLVLSSTYPRWAGDPEPAFVHELARRLVGRFEVTVLCPHAAGAKREEILDGVRVCRYRYAPSRWERLVNDGGILANLKAQRWKWLLLPSFVLGQWLAMLRLRLAWRPEVIHAHWLLPQGILAASAPAVPLVVTSHGADLFALKGGLFSWLRGKVIKRAAAVTVVSEAMRQRLRAECPEADARVMPMGVDLDARFTADAGEPRSRSTILSVGRLVEKKGLVHLIEAMPMVLAAHPDARLAIVGFGPERGRLEERVSQLQLQDAVHFVGAVPQSELPRHYRSAALFAAPFVEAAGGDQEGLGLVVAEAIGCLCPAVVGDVPAVHDLMGDAPGWVVPQRDPAALAKAIISVLDDPAAAARQVAGLRERLQQRISWRAVAAGYADLFDGLVSGAERVDA